MTELLYFLAAATLTLLVVALILRPSQRPRSKPKDNLTSAVSVQILVLGDIGRSPRMQYHALSVAKHGGIVQLIGYVESEPLPALIEHPNVAIVPLSPSPRVLQTSNKILFLLFGPFKVLLQVLSLLTVLSLRTRPSDWLMVQNPPSIPALAIARVVCWLRDAKLVIDWHNFGYSILALKLGQTHGFVSAAKVYEKAAGRLSDANITVTDALASILSRDFQIKSRILTMHDRPARQFQPMTTEERQAFLSTHALTAPFFEGIAPGKRKLLVSSTSWTADEDFSILLDALCAYSLAATSTHPQLPEILVVITGKGPNKDYYLRRMDELRKESKLEMVDIKTAWLSFGDYASLLGSADLGVSLHTSSSGVDLPMKIVDMFGAGLPVAGWSKFEAWPELVNENVNGRGFGSSQELTDIIIEVLDPSDNTLDCLKAGAILEGRRRWDEEWDTSVGKLLGLVA